MFVLEAFGNKNKQCCVQQFSADIEFQKITRQAGKLARVLEIVISDAKFFNRLSKGRYETSNSNMDNFTPLKANNFKVNLK